MKLQWLTLPWRATQRPRRVIVTVRVLFIFFGRQRLDLLPRLLKLFLQPLVVEDVLCEHVASNLCVEPRGIWLLDRGRGLIDTSAARRLISCKTGLDRLPLHIPLESLDRRNQIVQFEDLSLA